MTSLARRVTLSGVLLLSSLGGNLWAQDNKPAALLDRYEASAHMLPMRDGVKLHTIVVTQKETAEPLPFVLLRTPYGVANWPRHFDCYMKELAEDGYAFVFQDIRGRFGSEGTFVNYEGRAQRYFTVFEPVAPIRPAWRWLSDVAVTARSMRGSSRSRVVRVAQ